MKIAFNAWEPQVFKTETTIAANAAVDIVGFYFGWPPEYFIPVGLIAGYFVGMITVKE